RYLAVVSPFSAAVAQEGVGSCSSVNYVRRATGHKPRS
ncbi:hypothetical protein PC113_g24539, partial [Phytophthora cactorum]